MPVEMVRDTMKQVRTLLLGGLLGGMTLAVAVATTAEASAIPSPEVPGPPAVPTAQGWLPSQAEASPSATVTRRRIRYVVREGDSLSRIARRYDVTPAQIRRWNELDSDLIRVGQELVLHVEGRGGGGESRAEREVTHVVERGDTLSEIAAEYRVSVADLLRWNRGIDPDLLRVGQELQVSVSGGGRGSRGGSSASAGSPNDGRLNGGRQLQSGPGYRVRNGSRAYGTEETVIRIREALTRTHRRFPTAPMLAVGDLSYARGGRMSPHVSHQSGRDADIAYYTIGRQDRDGFLVATPENLDVEHTWYLMRTFIEGGDVQYIFVDYALQAVLYDYVRARGASPEDLERWFQYPREGEQVGIIRHVGGHDDHLHVRFECPSGDTRCED